MFFVYTLVEAIALGVMNWSTHSGFIMQILLYHFCGSFFAAFISTKVVSAERGGPKKELLNSYIVCMLAWCCSAVVAVVVHIARPETFEGDTVSEGLKGNSAKILVFSLAFVFCLLMANAHEMEKIRAMLGAEDWALCACWLHAGMALLLAACCLVCTICFAENAGQDGGSSSVAPDPGTEQAMTK
jgi:hypothetical protein